MTEWQQRAACANYPELFMATFSRSCDKQTIAEAVAICRTECPVAARCLAEHIGETDGVFGGTTGRERRRRQRLAKRRIVNKSVEQKERVLG